MTQIEKTSKLFGYARVSMQTQDLDLQMDALQKYGLEDENIFVEKISGKLKSAERPQLDVCLKMLRAGDTLVVWKLDRLGRSLHDLVNILSALEEKNVHFHSLTEAINTKTPTGKLMFHLVASFAEFERNISKERTLAGLESARKRGIVGGRRLKLNKNQQIALVAMYEKKVPVNDIMTHFQISRTCVYNNLYRYRLSEENKTK